MGEGGVPSLGPGEGGPRSRSRWGGSQVQVGGVPGLRSGGGTQSQVRGEGGVPGLSKGKKFLTPDLA